MNKVEYLENEIRTLETRRFMLNMADFMTDSEREADRNLREKITQLETELNELKGENDGRN